MDTIQSTRSSASVSTKKKETAVTQSDFWQTMEANRFAITPMLLVIIACIGGVAGAFVLQDNVIKLALIAFSVGFVEAAILAVMPMRTVVVSSIIALIISILVVLF